ncbi:MAG: germination protein YpeB [Clostridia bacterium]|nr:germination protein YpeB [Clostridia bacterium]
MEKKWKTTLVLMAVALAALGGAAARSAWNANAYQTRLREMYDGAVLSALRQMEDMELSLNKALLSQETGEMARYLNQVSAGAGQVQRSLSLLPLRHTATQAAVKFANQAADYAGALLRTGQVTQADARQLNALIDACGQYAQALYGARETLAAQAASGEYTFYDQSEDTNGNAYDSGVSYPTLIYDGPFSDARDTGTVKGLPDRKISREEALQIARDFVGADRVAEASPGTDTGGLMPCWGVTLKLKDGVLQAAVTKQGGKMLWMAPDSAGFEPSKTIEECRENARYFLERNGYAQMRDTYFQAYEGVMVISFAATQGSTVLYPDLIKVQLRMDTAQVVGWEARGYLQNHTARPPLTPAWTEDEARARVSARLDVDSSQLCLIPTDSGEKLCYEFKGTYQGGTYLVYINAQTGRQEQLLKVVEENSGLEAV